MLLFLEICLLTCGLRLLTDPASVNCYLLSHCHCLRMMRVEWRCKRGAGPRCSALHKLLVGGMAAGLAAAGAGAAAGAVAAAASPEPAVDAAPFAAVTIAVAELAVRSVAAAEVAVVAALEAEVHLSYEFPAAV